MVDVAGDVVEQFGPYVLGPLLGVGGMGEVYRAHDTRRDRDVALKLLPAAISVDEEYLARFRREQQIAARLNDPHIVPIHDFGEIDGRLFLDMRLVEGRHLGQILADDGPLPPARAVHLMSQVAEALDAAHADKLVHRDIKPPNILITARDFAYVADFGIARLVGTAQVPVTMTGATVGTLAYMAPERFTQGRIDGRVDVYALACVLHECLTGKPPFAGEDLPAFLYAHLAADPPRASALVKGVPAALDEVIRRGMAKDPDDRYATAGALAADAVVALLPAPARPPEAVAAPPTVRTGSTPAHPPAGAPAPPTAGPVPLVDPAPSNPVPLPDPALPDPALPDPALPDPAPSDPAPSDPVPLPEPVRSEPVPLRDPVRSGPVPVVSAPVGVAPAAHLRPGPSGLRRVGAEAFAPAAAPAPVPSPRRSAGPPTGAGVPVISATGAGLPAVLVPVPTSLPSRSRGHFRYRALLLTLVVGALVAAGIIGGLGRADGMTPTTEPPGTPGDSPFMPSPGEDASGQPLVRNLSATVAGDAPGLYGGTTTESCDSAQIAGFLAAHPEQAAAWAGVQGIAPGEIDGFLATLTPVTLRNDTAVTNHGFSGGRATELRSVLQSGTGVLVDPYGLPRVRCYCGNPLGPPAADTDYGDTVTKIQPSAAPVADFVVVQPGTDAVVARPRGSSGEKDRPADPAQTTKARTLVGDSFSQDNDAVGNKGGSGATAVVDPAPAVLPATGVPDPDLTAPDPTAPDPTASDRSAPDPTAPGPAAGDPAPTGAADAPPDTPGGVVADPPAREPVDDPPRRTGTGGTAAVETESTGGGTRGRGTPVRVPASQPSAVSDGAEEDEGA